MYMTIPVNIRIPVSEPRTEGKYAYLVATCCGGVMEDPDIHYEDYQVIRADSEYEAKKKYDELNHCSYYYGSVIQRLE